jgi:hypothetical protein
MNIFDTEWQRAFDEMGKRLEFSQSEPSLYLKCTMQEFEQPIIH